MLRHLKNANELILYASVSCGAAFIGRMFPAFFYPILLLRLGILGYCIYVIAGAEKNKELAVIIGGALGIGMIGGNWDLIGVYLAFDPQTIFATVSTAIAVVALIALIVMQVKSNGKTSKK
jgi:hypothetical protein